MNCYSSASSESAETSFTEKLDETITASSSSTEELDFDGELPEPDLDDFDNVPVLKLEDNARLLPKYTSILSKNNEDTVGMEDLELLQYDLEKLLSTNGLRTRFFLGEYTQVDKDDNMANGNTTLKRKMPEWTELKSGVKILKTDPFRPNEHTYKEISKSRLLKSNDFDKFWATVEPYCAPIGKDNLVFLDTLIQECEQDIDTKIPKVGEYYSKVLWDEVIDDEDISCKLTNNKQPEMTSFLESLGSKPTPRLLAATIHDKISQEIEGEADASAETASHIKTEETEKANDNADEIKTTKASTPILHRSPNRRPKIGDSLSKRLAKALVKEGILTNEDVKEETPKEDDIVKEVRKCKEEWSIVSDYTIVELNKLRSAVVNDIQCKELKDELDKVDKQMLELYNSYMVPKLQDEDKDKEKGFIEPMQPEFVSKANALLRQRYVLNRRINNMADMSYYC